MNELKVEMKKLLFGNQKQANVINDAVVEYVTEYFERCADRSFDGDLHEKVYHFLTELANSPNREKDADLFIQFVCGRQSLLTLVAGVPYNIYADQPSTESPKYNFRICALGEDMLSDEPEVKLEITAKPTVGPDEVYNEEDTFAVRALKIKDAIMPMVTTGVKEEIPDNEYAQALCVAEYYYGYKGN